MKKLPVLIAFVLAGIVNAEDQPGGHKFALLVGVQEYAGTGLGNLKYCEDDVHGLAALLPQIGYRVENVVVLTRRVAKEKDKDTFRPTASNIRRWLTAVCEDAHAGDSLLIAFAGHGVQLKPDEQQVKAGDTNEKMYFCPLDCDLADPKSLISIDELYAKLDHDCKATVKLLMVDACRNDPVDGKGPQGDERLASVTRPQLPDPPGGIAAFFSCSKGQRAFESDGLKHGIFFNYVIEGLRGKACNDDGDVTIPSLEDFLARKVPRRARDDQNNPEVKQIPERRGTVRGSVILATVTRDANALKFDLGDDIELEMVKVPADKTKTGDFVVRYSFYVSKYPITVRQFKRFVDATNYKTYAETMNKSLTWRSPGYKQSDNHPVVFVVGEDIIAFMDWTKARISKYVRVPEYSEWLNLTHDIDRNNYIFRSDIKENEAVDVGQANWCGAFDFRTPEWAICESDVDLKNLTAEKITGVCQGPVCVCSAREELLKGHPFTFRLVVTDLDDPQK